MNDIIEFIKRWIGHCHYINRHILQNRRPIDQSLVLMVTMKQIDHEAILQQIPAEEKALSPPLSVFYARIHPFKWSPIILRLTTRKARNSCGSADITVHEDPQSPSVSSDESPNVETPSKPRAPTRQSGTGQMHSAKSSQAAEKSEARHRHYCTLACLLRLVRKSPLDDSCPNVNAHRADKAGNHYALSRKSLAKLILMLR
jgi:hypothetical protein